MFGEESPCTSKIVLSGVVFFIKQRKNILVSMKLSKDFSEKTSMVAF